MADVTIRREWGEDDAVVVDIHVDDSYPDVVAEATARAVDTFRTALATVLAMEVPDAVVETEATDGE